MAFILGTCALPGVLPPNPSFIFMRGREGPDLYSAYLVLWVKSLKRKSWTLDNPSPHIYTCTCLVHDPLRTSLNTAFKFYGVNCLLVSARNVSYLESGLFGLGQPWVVATGRVSACCRYLCDKYVLFSGFDSIGRRIRLSDEGNDPITMV